MTNWLDIIPAIPLARGVPLVQLHVAGPPVTRGWVALGPDTCTLPSNDPSCTFLGNAISIDRGFMRVDLDDPQGFAYGLQLLAQHHGRSMGDDYGDIIMRSLWGNTTDEDRLVLAQALKETIDV